MRFFAEYIVGAVQPLAKKTLKRMRLFLLQPIWGNILRYRAEEVREKDERS